MRRCGESDGSDTAAAEGSRRGAESDQRPHRRRTQLPVDGSHSPGQSYS